MIQLTKFAHWREIRYRTGQMEVGQQTANADPCVLIVDDDPPLRDLIALTIRREQISAVTASDGQEAIDRLQEMAFRVVILDLMMPRVSGWDVIAWLAAHPSRIPCTVIVVTAADRSVFAALDPAVVNAIFVKPFDTYELAGYVARCCDSPLERDRRQKRLVGHA